MELVEIILQMSSPFPCVIVSMPRLKIRSTSILGLFVERRIGNEHHKFSFNKAVRLAQILNTYKLVFTDLPSISDLDAKAIFL